MPEEVKDLYLEASSIAEKSPAAAAALLRIALEKLCEYQGAKSESLRENIEEIYKDENIHEELMNAMDAVNISDTSSPDTINLDDNEEVVTNLARLLNDITEKTSKPQIRKKFLESFLNEQQEN